jgi:cell division protein FtsI/penicillin-binding protein 2
MNSPLRFQGRSRTLAVGLVVVMGIFVLQLFNLQVLQHEHYAQKAREAQVAKFKIPASRGKIYMQENGQSLPLVLNEPVYTVFADPQEVKDQDKIASTMRRIAGGNVTSDFEKGLENKKSRYVVLAKQLSRKQAELIRKEKLHGVGLQESTRRVYPEGKMAAQLLGFVDADGLGQYGIEGALNGRLKGKDGRLEAVTDVRRIPLTIGRDDIREPAKNGDDLVLTIDRGIQAYVEKALKEGLKKVQATKGNVIVMDPRTGGVLAMANFPTYDPAKYNEVKDYSVFQNGIVSDPYEAGSVIKTLTVGAGLDMGKITPNTQYHNTGSVQVDDATIHNAIQSEALGNITIQDALHFSLNTGMVEVLKHLGDGQLNAQARETLYRYFTKQYLFGKKTGIEQAGEAKGTIISPKDVQGNNVRYANMTFGQGMDVTMVQVAGAFSAAINGGTYYQPRLVDGVMKDGALKKQVPQVVKHHVLSPQASQTLREMVVKARQDGFMGDTDKKGYMIGGKTGTSQIIDPKTGEYTDDNSIGSYLGFGGDTTPKYVIMVQVRDSKAYGYAGTVAAAPIFGDISNWLIDYMKLQPR